MAMRLDPLADVENKVSAGIAASQYMLPPPITHKLTFHKFCVPYMSDEEL